MRSKKHLSILIILTVLAGMATISLPPASAQSTVVFRIEPSPSGGVAVGEEVAVDVYIDAPEGSGIVAWAINIKVDPDVLEPGVLIPLNYPPWWELKLIQGGESGYFLYDWCGPDSPHPTWPNGTEFIDGDRDIAAGTINDTLEAVVGWSDLEPGEGPSGTGKLVTFYCTSKNEIAYSPIEITEAYYYTSFGTPQNPDKHEPDIIQGHYNLPRVDLVQKSAWPGHHHHVVSKHTWNVSLFARIRNVGTETVEGKVVFTIRDSELAFVDSVETDSESLAPGEMYNGISTVWDAESAGYDKYYVRAEAWFKDAYGVWQKSPDKSKTFQFTVIP